MRAVIAATIEWSKEADSQSSTNKRASNGQQQWPPPRYRKQPTREELCARLFLLPSASDELVKAAYKCLAMKFHPDKQGGDEEQIKRINDAYQRLLAA
ncbi:MAG: DnaJ domain-containing protein [Pyrinomonadaceae bacterium]